MAILIGAVYVESQGSSEQMEGQSMVSVSTHEAFGSYYLKPSNVCVISVPHIHREG